MGEAMEMSRRASRSLPGSLLMVAACLGILLAATYATNAQDREPLKRDDGFFPLTRNQVIELQEILKRLGYKAGPANGIVSPEVAKAAEALAGLLQREVVRRSSGREIVLSCEITEGAPSGFQSIQIMVDEHRRIVIYNFQMPASRDFNPIRKIKNGYIDLSMKITTANDDMIRANNESSALAINKRDGNFLMPL